jgi:precorrin-3B synthase
VRLRLPGGQLSPTAMRALAGAAADLGDGKLELTSRANVQLRALTAPGAVAAVADRCAEAGLLPSATHERVRNILGSPLSGRDGLGATDIRPLLARLDAELCADPVLAALPGRFAFALDDGRGDVVGLGADVAWRAGADRLLLAGVDSGRRVADPVPALLGAARAFLALSVGSDGVWRVADLPDGVSRIAEMLGTGRGEPVRAAGTTGPPTVGRHGPACAVFAAPLGRLSAAQARLLADAADAAGGGIVVTPWRQVVVDLADDRWLDRLAGAGLVGDPASPWVGLSACAGVGGCERARGDVRADARAFADQAADQAAAGGSAPDGRRAVHWVGCERQCGRPAGPALVLIATGDGYETPQGTVDAAAARRLAAAWRSEGER